MGPGRGSGAGSLVAFALGITDLDPLEHDLLFERFLNPERVSMPDFDIDFCIDGRDGVIGYVADRYGKDRVSQIITFGTMAAKAVVRDVGRALGMPFGYVDRIAKLIPFELGMTLEKALKEDGLKSLYDGEPEVKELIDLGMKLEGIARNAGTHAGGVVIAPRPLTEFMPLYVEPDGSSLSQLDKDDAEAMGLVKFDFLGLRTLTIIDRALMSINRRRKADGLDPLGPEQIPMGDPATYELLRQCQTTGVFQLESRGMRDLVRRLQPDRFDDLVAVLALFRPGPLQSGMVDDFINRKHGTEPPAAVIRMIRPPLASEVSTGPASCASEYPFCLASSASEIAAEASSAKFGFPKNEVTSLSTPPTSSAPTKVLEAIRITGSTIGSIAMKKLGSRSSPFWASSSSSSRVSPCVSRNGTDSCRSRRMPNSQPPTDIGTAMIAPTKIITPRSIPSVAAIASGPGVGGTIEWVTAPPAEIAIRNSG